VFAIIPESLFDFDRNRCSICSGMTVRFAPEFTRCKSVFLKAFACRELPEASCFCYSNHAHSRIPALIPLEVGIHLCQAYLSRRTQHVRHPTLAVLTSSPRVEQLRLTAV
jgi:hypothetical protein